MRILVLWADNASANLGVRALAAGTAELARGAWPGVDVDFQNYGVRGSAPMGVGNPRGVVKEWATRRQGLMEWIQQYDLIMDTRAGDSFADIYGFDRLATMSVMAEFVNRSGVPLILTPQTFGPFKSRRSRILARRSLSTARLRMVRDHASAAQARQLRRPANIVTTDVVFALPVPPRVESRDVILNISGLLWQPGPHVDAARYRAVLREIYQGLVAKGREVSLLAHVLDSPVSDNDVPAVREFAAETAPAAEMILPTSLEDVRQVMAGARLVLGSRMHACLNGLSVGTPAIPLAYSRKFDPLLQDLGWRHTVDLRSEAEPADHALALADDESLAADVKLLNERGSAKLEIAVDALRGALP